MTDNQDPLQVLQSIIDAKETSVSSTSTSPVPTQPNQEVPGNLASPAEQAPSAQGPTPEQLVAQKAADAKKAAEAQARIQKLEEEQGVQDEQAIASLRQELPKIAPTTEEGVENSISDRNVQETDSDNNNEKDNPVEQLKRIRD